MSWINNIYLSVHKNSIQTKKQKQFGLLLVVIIAILLAISFYKNGFLFDVKQVVLLSSLLLIGVITILIPKLFYPFLVVWLCIGAVFGEISSFIILGILYYCFVTPITLFLRLKSKKEITSGWVTKTNTIDYKKLS
ncbi:MAG: hypothetical protein KBT69_05765 [Oceanihabitans sp.]|nr:hypothetical protein [Oceanihabitans sp.]